jgi:hypothetical protein
MPTVLGVDSFRQDLFVVGNPYVAVNGTPARDLLTVRPGDPASLLLDTSGAIENLHYPDYTAGVTRMWYGFAWRLDSEPAVDEDIAFLAPLAGSAARLAYSPGSDVIYHFVGGSGTQSIAYTLGTWAWIEQIFEIGANPRILHTRVNGTDLTDVSLAEASSTAWRVVIGGPTPATLSTFRYSMFLWGTAASAADWLGESPASIYRPATGIVLDDTPSNLVSKVAMAPWEVVGAAAPNTLGQISSTTAIPRVYESTVPPTSLDDSVAGYAVGDIWVDIDAEIVYWCVSGATGAAVWKQASI